MAPFAFLQSPIRWLQATSRYQATTSGGPNSAYELCARKITAEQRATIDPSSWEVALTDAEPIRSEHEMLDILRHLKNLSPPEIAAEIQRRKQLIEEA